MLKIVAVAALSAVSLLNDIAAAEGPKSRNHQAHYDRAADPHEFTVFMPEGGWCWFQDPRAVVRGDFLILGAVQGNADGAAVIGVYDLQRRRIAARVIAHKRFDRDDHNSPVFHVRGDASVLAVYARHGRETHHYSRLSASDNPTNWGPETEISYPAMTRDNVTYMNLFMLRKEQRLYNFFRGLAYNPSFVTSDDEGRTWSDVTHFIRSDLEGRHRPYARYASDGEDTIHVAFTDAHPHRFGNSIYYTAFRNGAFLRADGSPIKRLRSEGPLTPAEADLVFQGGGEWAPAASSPGVRPSARRAAWTSSIAIDSSGFPHIGYSVHLTQDDLRYRVASWTGSRWRDREVAHAGRCLYPAESSYTGLITLDPDDPRFVAISTDADPRTGRFEGGRHEIYTATIEANDDVDSIRWHPVTRNSPVRNIRPVILRDRDRRILLWNRGDFRTYSDYQLDTVGVVETLDGDGTVQNWVPGEPAVISAGR